MINSYSTHIVSYKGFGKLTLIIFTHLKKNLVKDKRERGDNDMFITQAPNAV